MTSELLFVYGTLRRDTQSEMYRLFMTGADFISQASYQGRLYMVDYYPGVVASDKAVEKVKGEVYRLHDADALLVELDQYEECGAGFSEPTEYVRKIQTVILADGSACKAWVYLYNRAVDELVQIQSGDFLAELAG